MKCVIYRLVLRGQRTVAMVSEMMHVASLVHDDIVDVAELRRGLPSTQKAFGQRQVSPFYYSNFTPYMRLILEFLLLV